MSPLTGPSGLLKAAFVHFAAAGAEPAYIVFPYNPESLTRTLLPGAAPGADPLETIVFTLALDATDQLAEGSAEAAQNGVYPVLSAIELLMYPASVGAGTMTLFVWGPNRIVPVAFAGLRITEQAFNPNLSPMQASVEVTLNVVSADAAGASEALGYFQGYLKSLNSLAASAYGNSAAPLGIAAL